jgi:hypothetical protein
MTMCFLFCTGNHLAGTIGGTQTTNGVVAKITYKNGLPVVNATVSIRPVDFYGNRDDYSDKNLLIDTKTDLSGNVSADIIIGKSYYIVVKDSTNQGVLIPCAFQNESESELDLGTYQVDTCAIIRGKIENAVNAGVVYIKGVDGFAGVDPVGNFSIGGIPAHSSYEIIYEEKNAGTLPMVCRSSSIVPGDTLNIVVTSKWLYSKRIFFNTTSTGAAINETVEDFPVVILLNQKNFDFSQVKQNNLSLQFFDINGKILNHQIEHWDSIGKNAAIWVLVPVIKAKSNSQYITMQWGNNLQVKNSGSKYVFTWENFFLGVWHMEPALLDASDNGNDGIDFRTRNVDGVIGAAREFAFADSSGIKIPDDEEFDINGQFTLSAWVKSRSSVNDFATIVSKGNGSFRLHLRSPDNVPAFSITQQRDTGWKFVSVNAAKPLTDTLFHHVAGVYNGVSLLMYIDGQLSAELECDMDAGFSKASVWIGRHADYQNRSFEGALDEVRICDIDREPEWIKLCYENQRPGQKFLVLK